MLNKIEEYRNKILKNDVTGHSIDHINRVVKLTEDILENNPQVNKNIALVVANVHDLIDEKVVPDVTIAKKQLSSFLTEQNISYEDINKIFFIIENMSYSKNLRERVKLPIEGQIVQDADRLDAIGAIGIGRAFYYGGSKGSKLYDPNIVPRSKLTHDKYRKDNTVINHFYEKLLLLKDQMNTSEGKKIAENRHKFMLNFLEEFKSEY